MQLRNIMVPDPAILAPDATLREAAVMMRDIDSGVMPIGDNDRLVGMLTDRDITIRATAEGKDPERTPLRDVMSSEIVYCFEDDNIEVAARKMEEHQIRRLILLNRDKRLVGIASLGDLAIHEGSNRLAGEAIEAVSESSQ